MLELARQASFTTATTLDNYATPTVCTPVISDIQLVENKFSELSAIRNEKIKARAEKRLTALLNAVHAAQYIVNIDEYKPIVQGFAEILRLKNEKSHVTDYYVMNANVINTVKALIEDHDKESKGSNTVLINFTNGTRNTDVLRGKHGREEEIMYRTTLFSQLKDVETPIRSVWTKVMMVNNADYEQIHDDDEKYTFNVFSVSDASTNTITTWDPTATDENNDEAFQMYTQMFNILLYCHEKNQKIVVLGLWDQQHRHSPKVIAQMWLSLLLNVFTKSFEHVVFANSSMNSAEEEFEQQVTRITKGGVESTGDTKTNTTTTTTTTTNKEKDEVKSLWRSAKDKMISTYTWLNNWLDEPI